MMRAKTIKHYHPRWFFLRGDKGVSTYPKKVITNDYFDNNNAADNREGVLRRD